MSVLTIFESSPESTVKKANKFKLKQNWTPAGRKFKEAAELYRQKGEDFEVAKCLSEAANCFVKDDARLAILALNEAAGIHGELGHVNFAAGMHKNVAEWAVGLERKMPGHLLWTDVGGHSQLDQQERQALEKELQESALSLAARQYAKAADLYRMENSPANEAECREERAKVLADKGDGQRAADEFKELTRHAEKHELLSARKHAFQACLCRLAAGLDPEVDEIGRECPDFARSDHSQLVRDLAAAASETAVMEARRNFEKFNEFDKWQERRFAEVKRGKIQ